MKRLFQVIVFCCLAPLLMAQEREVEPVQFNKLSENLYEVTGGRGSRGGMYIGDDDVLIIDAKMDEASVGEVIEVSQQSNSESTNEYDPRVAALPGGGFAVAWISTRPDGNGVMMRHYDGNGTPRADEYLAAPTSGRTSMTVLGVDLVTVPEFGVAVGAIVRNSSDSQTASFQTISAAGEPFGDASSFDFDGAGLQTFAMHRGDNGSLAAAYVVDAEEFADRDDVEVRIMDCPAE